MKEIRVDADVYSLSEIAAQRSALATELSRAGLMAGAGKGRLFALCMPHPLRLLVCLEMINESGGSLLLIHPDTPRQTCMGLAKESGCHYLLYGEEIIGLPGEVLYPSPSLVQFSSGTTGKPKQIVRSWDNVLQEVENYNRLLCSTADEVPVILVPVSHSFGLIAGVLSAFSRGATPHLVTNRNPKYFMKVIAGYRRPLVYGVPFQFHLIHALNPDFVLHKLISSGAPLNEKLFRTLKENGSGVMQQYGCTECGCIALAQAPESPHDNGHWLSHFTVETSTDKAEPKEIVVRTNQAVIHTRDLGFISERGSLYVLNRLDDLINVSGQKVTPSEVEEVVSRLEGIKEVVVYGARHKVWGECVGALVVSEKHYAAAAVKDHCMRHLAAYKVPAKIRFVEEIPKTANGKISRSLIKAKEEQDGQSEDH